MIAPAVPLDDRPRRMAISEGLSVRDLRWIADAYEQAQRVRLETAERIRAILQGRDDRKDIVQVLGPARDVLTAIRRAETDGPVPLLGRTLRRYADEERELRKAMLSALALHPAWPWLEQVKGMGATLAAKLLSRLDVTRARSPSSFWAYCGLATVPGIEYRCAACGVRVSYPTRYRVKGPHLRPDTKSSCEGSLTAYRGPENGVRVAQPRPGVGEKPSYDQYVKKVCYLIGVSFLRSGSTYADYYREQRERLGRERRGWTAGRIHFSALRKMEKLFLAHLWLVWREAVGLPTTTPYAQAILEREDYIEPGRMIDPVRHES